MKRGEREREREALKQRCVCGYVCVSRWQARCSYAKDAMGEMRPNSMERWTDSLKLRANARREDFLTWTDGKSQGPVLEELGAGTTHST